MQSLGLFRLVFDTGLTVTHRPYRVLGKSLECLCGIELSFTHSFSHSPTHREKISPVLTVVGVY